MWFGPHFPLWTSLLPSLTTIQLIVLLPVSWTSQASSSLMAFMFFLPEMLFFHISAQISSSNRHFLTQTEITNPSLPWVDGSPPRSIYQMTSDIQEMACGMPLRRLGEPSHYDARLTHVKREERKEGWVWCSSDKVLARCVLSPQARVTTGGVVHPTAGFSIPTMLSHGLGAALGKRDLSMNVAVGATDETISQWRSPQ